MKVVNTKRIIYLKKRLNYGDCMEVYRRRVPCKLNEKIYKTTVYNLGKYEEMISELKSIYNKHCKYFKHYIEKRIANELHVSTEAITWLDENSFYLYHFSEEENRFNGSFYLNCELEELELNDRDLAERQKEKDNEHNRKMINTFAKASIENVISKYGVYYNDITNQLLIDRSELNHILLEMYSKMVDELHELGINVKLTKDLISLDTGKIMALTKINSVKLELSGGVIENGGKTD